MLLIDGVEYDLQTPANEDEFEQVVKEHAQDIFSEQSIYLDRKQKLKSLSGIGSIPDGYVIVFGDSPQWHIVEVELSSHPLHDHIVSQVGRFISGINNTSIQRGIVNAIYEEITSDDFLKLRLKKAIEPAEIYRFLSDLISKQPTLTIIIERDTEELREALSTLRYPEITVVEFQTFVREGVGLPVHAHLFEPLSEIMIRGGRVSINKPEVSARNDLYRQFFSELVEEYSKQNPSWHRIKAQPMSYLGFGAGKSGMWFNWAFRDNKRFAVQLDISTGDKIKNKSYFDEIKESEERVRSALSLEISWERLDEKKASRIAVYTKGEIDEAMKDTREKERIIKWASLTMKCFSDILKDIIANL